MMTGAGVTNDDGSSSGKSIGNSSGSSSDSSQVGKPAGTGAVPDDCGALASFRPSHVAGGGPGYLAPEDRVAEVVVVDGGECLPRRKPACWARAWRISTRAFSVAEQ